MTNCCSFLPLVLFLASHAHTTSAWISGSIEGNQQQRIRPLSSSLRQADYESDDEVINSEKYILCQGRRDFMAAAAAAAVFTLSTKPADAAVTDETDAFAAADSAYRGLSRFDPPAITRQQSTTATSDEFVVSIAKEDLKSGGGLGLELADIVFRD